MLSPSFQVYCLPDGYEIHESSLNDIKVGLSRKVRWCLVSDHIHLSPSQFVINPTFNKEQVASLDTSNTLAYDLHNRKYLPGM